MYEAVRPHDGRAVERHHAVHDRANLNEDVLRVVPNVEDLVCLKTAITHNFNIDPKPPIVRLALDEDAGHGERTIQI